MKCTALFLALLAVVACAPVAPPAPAEMKEYAGTLVGETHWSGDVVLADDVVIPAGSTLTIMRGTRVHVRPSVSTKIEPEQLSSATELLIRGRMVARGTEEQPIEFVLEGDSEASPAWAGIIADRSKSFVLEHVAISRAEQALWLIGARASVQHCTITDSRYGMVFQLPGVSAVINNRVVDGEAGVFCWKGASPRLVNNIVSGNVEEGLFIDAESRPILENNTVSGNGIGLVTADAGYAQGTTFHDNGIKLMLLGEPR